MNLFCRSLAAFFALHFRGSETLCPNRDTQWLTTYSARRIKSLSFIPKASAKELATSIPTLTLPNSIDEMYVR